MDSPTRPPTAPCCARHCTMHRPIAAPGPRCETCSTKRWPEGARPGAAAVALTIADRIVSQLNEPECLRVRLTGIWAAALTLEPRCSSKLCPEKSGCDDNAGSPGSGNRGGDDVGGFGRRRL